MTKELKELVSFGLSCGELIAGVADGVGFDDVGKLIAVARTAGPGLEKAGDALIEYVSMSDAEAAELESFVEAEFDIADDKIEAGIEIALKICIQLHALVGVFLKPKP